MVLAPSQKERAQALTNTSPDTSVTLQVPLTHPLHVTMACPLKVQFQDESGELGVQTYPIESFSGKNKGMLRRREAVA